MNAIYWHMNATLGGANLHPGVNLLPGANLHPGANCAHEHGFRILKFGTNIRYDKLYRVFKNQPHMLISPFICPFFFLSDKIFYYRFLSFYFSQSL